MMNEEQIAAQCRHYAMCKIDFLGTGVCPVGRDNHYVSYYPQGRMDIYSAVCKGKLPVTPALADIVDACDLCGICDGMCYFVTQLRPLKVARALKNHVAKFLEKNQPIAISEDPVLDEMRAIVGKRWASNDPAHQAAYASDPSPMSAETRPAYVALPGSATQVQALMRLCRRHELTYAIRGNGSSVMGFVLNKGLVLDMARMKWIHFDEKNWCVRVGAGVSAFELQQEAYKKGYRVNTAEPAALYCANIMCSGIFSLFSSTYGTGADNYIDADFVSSDGCLFRLSNPQSPNLFAFRKQETAAPGVCTQAVVRLHPMIEDEAAVMVPFHDFRSALAYSRELNRRGIGIGLLGKDYLTAFASPTREVAAAAKTALSEDLGMTFVVLVLGDKYALDSARRLAPTVLPVRAVKALLLGMPTLAEGRLSGLLADMEGDARPYELFTQAEMSPLIETLLEPSAQTLASAVDEDLQSFFVQLYEKPEMTDLLWLNTFRIISARMGRDGHVAAFILYVPLDDLSLIETIDRDFSRLAAAHDLRGGFGFLTPIDRGRCGVLEWDMYLDHTDPEQVTRMREAMAAAGRMIDILSRKEPRIVWIRDIFNQGFSRKENWLYHQAAGGRRD